MSDSQRAGRTILVTYLALILLASIGIVAAYVAYRGTGRLPAQLARVVLTAWMCYALYRGSWAAKWLAVVLFTLGGALAAPGVMSDDPAVAALMAGMAALYTSFATVLLASRRVNNFLGHQRAARLTEQ